MDDLSRDYVVWIFLAAVGVIQVASAHAGLTKLLFIRAKPWAMALGVVLIVAGFVWFFREGPRHFPDTAGGINGNEQGARVALTCLAAGAFTFALSSLLYRREDVDDATPADGFEALRRRTYAQALVASMRTLVQEARRWTRR
ncbi:MAG: hypothetical protein OXK21_03050 [Chloroflexota bacterium]|nr:hypothetical protein [Chloroflexota bacterium]